MEKTTPKQINEALKSHLQFYKNCGWEVDSEAVRHYLTDYITAIIIAVEDGYLQLDRTEG